MNVWRDSKESSTYEKLMPGSVPYCVRVRGVFQPDLQYWSSSTVLQVLPVSCVKHNSAMGLVPVRLGAALDLGVGFFIAV